MSTENSQTVPQVVETTLEGGKAEVIPEVIQGGQTEVAAPAAEPAAEVELKGGKAEEVVELTGGEVSLEGGKRRKTRSDKGRKRSKSYRRSPSTRLRRELEKLEETPGGEAVYLEGSSSKCRRGHRYSRKHGTCVKHLGGSHRRMRSYNHHRKHSGSLKSSRHRRHRRSRSRSRSHRRTRSGRKY